MELKVCKSDHFEILLVVSGDELGVKIVGWLDENATFDGLVHFVENSGEKIRRIHFDVSSISKVNSSGIPKWLALIQQIQSLAEIDFTKLNEVFIEQANLVPAMLGQAKTLGTIQLPFFCPKCRNRFLIEKEASAVAKAGFAPGEVECRMCRSPLSFDGFPEEYLAFLRQRSGKTSPSGG